MIKLPTMLNKILLIEPLVKYAVIVLKGIKEPSYIFSSLFISKPLLDLPIKKVIPTNNIKYKDVKFRKISLKKYHSLLGQTKAVLDIPSKTQTGATMRTIETLSMSRKLISTNPTLQQEIFYNPNNIYIWNSNQPLQISSFLVTPFNPDSNRYIKNIRQWLEALYLI